ncbi:MAG TPA: ABC transporter ATP-binding protein [Pyrinomonadaceae bacterium]|nr:ABC transporter ATP-binding protein [Pyrinomonadaceae bacterium]
MTDLAIRCEGLAKQYRIGEREPYTALRDVISEAAAAPFRRLSKAFSNGSMVRQPTDFSIRNPQSAIRNSKSAIANGAIWALDDVSFEVKRGEVVGIIGRNGAGKSTLLKILSRITKPTRGQAEIHGRVGSLLEVGTGFHPELTGRENIYLNGAILGMRKAEIERKFDEIVAFAEVEKFIDTPVKRYSSGMYVRLAFAVAAHMDTEILLVDEVLAVGDAAFQQKCLGKMEEVSRGGKTILFVSHQMAAVQNLCEKGLLLSHGQIVQRGPIAEVVTDYLAETNFLAAQSLESRVDRQGCGSLRFTEVSFKDGAGKKVTAFTSGAPAVLELALSNTIGCDLRKVRIGVGIDNEFGQRIVLFSSHLASRDFSKLPATVSSLELRIPRMTLAAGRYTFTLFASVNGEIADWIKHAGTLHVEDGDFFGTGQMPPPGQGCFVMDHEFCVR